MARVRRESVMKASACGRGAGALLKMLSKIVGFLQKL
jgi:hypothetical protein